MVIVITALHTTDIDKEDGITVTAINTDAYSTETAAIGVRHIKTNAVCKD